MKILRPGYCLSNGSIVTRPSGQFINGWGDIKKDHQSQYSTIPPVQGSPAAATAAQSLLAMAVTAGATAADISAIIRFDSQLTSAGSVQADEYWLAGLKLDLRYGNNMQPAPFTCLIRPIFRDIVTNLDVVDPASSWDHSLVPNGGANSSSEFFFFMGRSSISTVWDAANSEFTSPTQQQSRLAKSLKMVGRNDAAGAVFTNFGRNMAQDLVFNGVVVILQGQAAITQSSSVSPFFGSFDSPNVISNLEIALS